METGSIRAATTVNTRGVLWLEMESVLETRNVIAYVGDFDNQTLYHKLSVNQPLYAIRGGSDRGWPGGPGQANRLEIGGTKFIMAHRRMDVLNMLKDVQVVTFGHSHMYYQQEISGRLWLNPGGCSYKRFTLPLSMAVMAIEERTYGVETIWLEHGHRTPGAATSQREKAKAGRYEKYQRRYRQKQAKGKGQTDKAKDAVMTARYEGRPVAKREAVKLIPDQEKEYLFLMTKILCLGKADESREWAIRNLRENFRLIATIYDIYEKKSDANARQILELLLEQISLQRKRLSVEVGIPAQQVRIKVTT